MPDQGVIRDIWRFICAVTQPFAQIMTGAPTAPVTALHIIVPSLLSGGAAAWWGHALGKIALGALFLYFLTAVFLAWRHQYREKIAAENKLKSCLNPSPPRWSPSDFGNGPQRWRGMCFRIEITNTGEITVVDCEGYLTDIHYKDETREMGPMLLTWADTSVNTTKVNLRRNVPRGLDLLIVHDNNEINVCHDGWPYGTGWPINQQKFFSRVGKYYLTVVVGGHGTATLDPLEIEFDFTGDWRTSTMKYL